jgi:hypothetical protein
MSPFKVDFSDVQEFDAMPAGVYEAVVTTIRESEEEGRSGYPYSIVEMTVKEGEFENRKLWLNLSHSPKAAFKVKEFLLSVGESEEALADPEFEFVEEKYEGASLMVSVEQRNYEGVIRNSVKKCLPKEGGPKGTGPGGQKGRKVR